MWLTYTWRWDDYAIVHSLDVIAPCEHHITYVYMRMCIHLGPTTPDSASTSTRALYTHMQIRVNDMDSGNTVSIFTSRKLYAHGLKQQAGQSKLCSLRHFRQTARPSLLKLVDGRFWNVPTWSGCWWILTSWRICSTGAHSNMRQHASQISWANLICRQMLGD